MQCIYIFKSAGNFSKDVQINCCSIFSYFYGLIEGFHILRIGILTKFTHIFLCSLYRRLSDIQFPFITARRELAAALPILIMYVFCGVIRIKLLRDFSA